MIWLTWRQYRVHAGVLYSVLLAFAAALLLTGPHLAEVYRQDASMFLTWVSAQRSDRTLYNVGIAAGYVVPVLIGAFWGAPMVARELESGTHRLVWSQTVTRNHWLAAKLGLGLLGATVATAIMSLGLTWWAHPVDRAVNAGGGSDGGSSFQVARISPDVFASRGLAPVGYAAVAFTLGVLAGAVLRRTVPAMAVTLAVYVLLQVFMPSLVRVHLASPRVTTTAVTAETLHGFRGSGRNQVDAIDVAVDVPGAWVLGSETVDASGEPIHAIPTWVLQCLPPPGSDVAQIGPREQACFGRLTSDGYGQRTTYQPASHYWALQWRETGLLLAGSAALAGACFWRVRRLS